MYCRLKKWLYAAAKWDCRPLRWDFFSRVDRIQRLIFLVTFTVSTTLSLSLSLMKLTPTHQSSAFMEY